MRSSPGFATIAILLLALPVSGAPQAPPDPAAAPAPSPAPAPPSPVAVPDFGFTDMKGGSHTLAELRGEIVLLEFWAPWCVPCRKGFPFLDHLQAKHGPAGLKVMAVTLEEDSAAVEQFLAGFPGVKFLVGRDPTGKGGEVFDVTAMPTTLLLDREGQVMARFEGGTEAIHKQEEAALDAVMAGRPLPPELAAVKRKEGPRGNLKAWERGYLADPIMNLDGDTLSQTLREHIHSSKEGAAGTGGVAGGGCGCN